MLGGCVAVPGNETPFFPVETKDVVRNIRCELRNAMWDPEKLKVADSQYSEQERLTKLNEIDPNYSWFTNQSAGMELTLKIAQNDSTTASSSFGFPILPVGLATLDMGGGYSAKATRTEKFSFNEALFDGWKKYDDVFVLPENGEFEGGSVSVLRSKDGEARFSDAGKNKGYSLKVTRTCSDYYKGVRNKILAGNLGIDGFLRRIHSTHNTLGPTDNKSDGPLFRPRKLVYTVEFVIGSTSNIGPTFSMIPIGTRNTGGGFNLKSSRDDTHTLKITFTKIRPYSTAVPVVLVTSPNKVLRPLPKIIQSEEVDKTSREKGFRQKSGKPVLRPKTSSSKSEVEQFNVPLENIRRGDQILFEESLRDLVPRLDN